MFWMLRFLYFPARAGNPLCSLSWIHHLGVGILRRSICYFSSSASLALRGSALQMDLIDLWVRSQTQLVLPVDQILKPIQIHDKVCLIRKINVKDASIHLSDFQTHIYVLKIFEALVLGRWGQIFGPKQWLSRTTRRSFLTQLAKRCQRCGMDVGWMWMAREHP